MRFGEEPPDEGPPGFNERPDIIRSAMEYRQEQRRRTAPPPKEERSNGATQPLHTVTGAVLASRPVPVRNFLDADSLLPMRQVVMLSGDGGMGKSLLALQLALDVSTGAPWIGIAVQAGPVVYLSAEEDESEVAIRQSEIAAAEGIDASQAFTLEYITMAGEDAVLAHETGNGAGLKATPFFTRLEATLDSINPALVVLDNLADVFAGNENNRGLAKRFVGMLRHLAIRYDCVVLLLAHPSLTGLASGSGLSGSTAWNNSVRARLYLHRPDTTDEDETLRVLEVKKANYGPSGQRYSLRWVDGCFHAQEFAKPFDNVTTADLEKVRELFSNGLWRVHEQSQDWGGYAVAAVLDVDVGRGVNRKSDRTAEQNHNRDDVRKILATWLRNKAIYVIDGVDARREPTKFYSTKEATS